MAISPRDQYEAEAERLTKQRAEQEQIQQGKIDKLNTLFTRQDCNAADLMAQVNPGFTPPTTDN